MTGPATPDDAGAGRLATLLDATPAMVPASDVGIIVAHPDDETIGCGAQLARWEGATLVMVTDGAPENLVDARAQGFGDRASYAAARRRELREALAVAGFSGASLVRLDVPDQQAPRRLMEVASRLLEIAEERELSVLFTHAYEGGHPDHDATAFAVHAAGALLSGKGMRGLVVEMPFYRSDESGGMIRQQFVPVTGIPVTEIRLSPPEVELKRRMMAAHGTQSRILEAFAPDVERFRLAPGYDFTVLPNGGRLLYEQFDWGLAGSEWVHLVRAALAGLGLADRPAPTLGS